MKRACTTFLIDWLHSSSRIPLVMRGARQVGKTWLIRHLAQTQGLNLIEMNFESKAALAKLFNVNDPHQIIKNIEASLHIKIDPRKSLLFLDEIQVAPHLIATLRWFAEEMPELPVIAAGSLLEFELEKPSYSVPVGRIGYVYVEPMSFLEFLLAKNRQELVEYIKSFAWKIKIPQPIHEELINLFKEYIIVGGMPRAVEEWIESNSLEKLSMVHQNLSDTYEDDFNRYRGSLISEHLEEVLAQIPKSLGKKFVYRKVNKEVHTSILKKALDLLCTARICHKVRGTAANGVPLAAELLHKYNNVILLDVGLCSASLRLSLEYLKSISDIDLINSRGIAEQVVGQLLRTIFPFFQKPELYYWVRTKTDSSAEIDYVIQHGSKVVPIEVKAGGAGSLKSLHFFMELKKLSKALRISSGVPQIMDINIENKQGKTISYKLCSLPFYLMSELHRLLDY